jgi:ATP-dependent helicase/nuclease subunit A
MMSIHSAKGLQSPIVIIPYATQQRSFQNRDQILWLENQENQSSFPIIFTSKTCKSHSKINTYLQQKYNQEEQENHRLFYVALTRAEEELYLTGVEKARSKVNWYEMSKNAINTISNLNKTL